MEAAAPMESAQLQAVFAWIWHASPVLFGASGGYLFYRFIGCKSGFCPITRNPWFSTLYGAAIGAMMMSR